MPGEIVASNDFLKERLTATVASMNAGHSLHLFVNDFEPTPADNLGSFDEAAFSGYNPRLLTGLWPAPLKVQDGEYVSILPVQTYTSTGGLEQTVYGWYVKHGAQLQLSARLITPVPVQFGVVFSINVEFQEWALSILT